MLVYAHTREADGAGSPYMLCAFQLCGMWWKRSKWLECLRLWNQVDCERQTIPRALEIDAEANTRLNKANFWLSLFTSNSPSLPLLSLPLLLCSAP